VSPADNGKRRLLPLTPTQRVRRAEVTCTYRCGNACSHEAPNTSDNNYFGDIVRDVVSRRGMLKAGAVLAAAGAGTAVLAGTAGAAPDQPADAAAPAGGADASGGHPLGLNFDPVKPNKDDKLT